MAEPIMKKILFIVCFFATVSCHSQDHARLKLWYTQPSGNTWENALPIGNGRLGAMVYGNVDTERIQLNENTLWSGSPNRNDNPLALDSLAGIAGLNICWQTKRCRGNGKQDNNQQKITGANVRTTG